jgi:RecJ-like exonuclease
MAFGDSASDKAGEVVGGALGVVALVGLGALAIYGFKGCSKNVHCSRCNNSKVCTSCKGKGRELWLLKCSSCDGTGKCPMCS